jgi:hypothetical protein
MPVGDPGCAQRLGQRVSVELRIPARAWEAADVDYGSYVRRPEQPDQLL